MGNFRGNSWSAKRFFFNLGNIKIKTLAASTVVEKSIVDFVFSAAALL